MQPNQDYNPYAPPTADVDQGLQPGSDEYILAERGTRFLAALIDSLLMFGAAVPGIVLMFVAFEGIDRNPFGMLSGSYETILLPILAVGLLVLVFQSYQWYLVTTTGQSLAKKWMGIKIVRTDGSPCGFVNGVLLRSWVPYLVSNFIPVAGRLFGLVNVLFIFGEERRCLHDHIASTRVIVAPQA